jgi:hypothetical protein
MTNWKIQMAARKFTTIGVYGTRTEKSDHESQTRQHPKLIVTEKVIYSYA